VRLPEEELLAPGHRACPGCGEVLALRLILKALGRRVIVVQATGCMEVTTTPYPQTAWRVPWIHGAFENAAAIASGVEAALRRLGREGIKVVAMGGDGGTADIGLQALSGMMERGHNVLYVCTDNEAYMNCLDPSTLVLTEGGLKRVSEVRVGELLYSFDPQRQALVARRCSGVFFNGVHDLYEVVTPHHLIRATPNHPFLILERGGRNRLVWKTLSQLRVGDEVVVLKKIPYGHSYRFNFRPARIGDPEVDHLPVRIPERSSPELMKLLGIWLGDGWVRPERGEVGFALPEGKRRELVGLSQKVLGTTPTGNESHLYLYSSNLARFIDSLGFGRGPENKTIPGWVFTLPVEEREALVEGMMLADGYSLRGSHRYVSASRELLRRLRLLLQTLNYRVEKIPLAGEEGREVRGKGAAKGYRLRLPLLQREEGTQPRRVPLPVPVRGPPGGQRVLRDGENHRAQVRGQGSDRGPEGGEGSQLHRRGDGGAQHRHPAQRDHPLRGLDHHHPRREGVEGGGQAQEGHALHSPGPPDPLRGHRLRGLSPGPGLEGQKGGGGGGPLLPPRPLPLPHRLEARLLPLDQGGQAGGGDGVLDPLRGGEGRDQDHLQAREEEAGEGVPQAAGEVLPPHGGGSGEDPARGGREVQGAGAGMVRVISPRRGA
jgi:hypothetical protein